MTERFMELGERRRVTLRVWLEGDKPFQPQDAKWELIKSQDVVATGPCETAADGATWQLTAEIEPESRGDYRLSYQFGMGTEIVRRSIPIKVI